MKGTIQWPFLGFISWDSDVSGVSLNPVKFFY